MLTLLLAALAVTSDQRHDPLSYPGARLAQSAVAPEVPRDAPCTLSNLVVTPMLRPVIDVMWRTSPTFKTQCARLGQAPSVLVSIAFGNQSQVGARGRVQFVRSAGEMVRAEVLVYHDFRSMADLVEVVAHELEHVIEQLDGVRLTPDATHGVHRTSSGAFETARAVHVGQQVSGEVDAARDRTQKSGTR